MQGFDREWKHEPYESMREGHPVTVAFHTYSSKHASVDSTGEPTPRRDPSLEHMQAQPYCEILREWSFPRQSDNLIGAIRQTCKRQVNQKAMKGLPCVSDAVVGFAIVGRARFMANDPRCNVRLCRVWLGPLSAAPQLVQGRGFMGRWRLDSTVRRARKNLGLTVLERSRANDRRADGNNSI